MDQARFEEVATGLQFPEGPVALADGSVLLVEMGAKTLTRITAAGKREVVAELGGGPNGAALGPDGRCYVCNNGGLEKGGGRFEPGGGSIQRVDLPSGRFETLYTQCADWPINAANDLVFDAHGGFYFTDFGKRSRRTMHRGRVCHASADGSSIREVISAFDSPNGIGLSADGGTLFVAQTDACRLWAFDVVEPGVVRVDRSVQMGARHLGSPPFFAHFDSLALDAEGRVLVGTLYRGGISVFEPNGAYRFIPLPDSMVTNLCFGGPQMRTLYVTLAETGRLVALEWQCPGLPLNHRR
jgi:gluconolactonase